jgi:hypothetical protein
VSLRLGVTCRIWGADKKWAYETYVTYGSARPIPVWVQVSDGTWRPPGSLLITDH